MVPDRLLTNLLVNLGRMDWRRSEGKTEGSLLLAHVWRSFDDIEHEWDDKIEAIKSVAIYQPTQALNFVRRRALRNKPMRTLPEILRNIAYSGQAFQDVLDILWRLGASDNTSIGSNTSHAIRVITELADYDVRKPLFFSEGVLEFALKLCDDPAAWDKTHTPLDLLKPLMSAEGVHITSSRLAFMMEPFLVPYEDVEIYRGKILDKVMDLLSSDQPRIAFEAAAFIEIATRGSVGRLGMTGTKAHSAPFYAEFRETLERVLKKVQQGILPIAAAQIQYKVQWLTRHGRELSPAAKAIMKAMPNTPEFILREVLYGKIEDRFLDDNIDTYEARSRKYMKARCEALEVCYPNPQDRVRAVEVVLQELAQVRAAAQPYFALHHLFSQDINFVSAFCEACITNPDSQVGSHASQALSYLIFEHADLARKWYQRFLETGEKKLAMAITNAFSYKDEKITAEDIAVVRQLVESDDADIAGSAIHAIATWRNMPAPEKLSLLATANFASNGKAVDDLALAICGPERDEDLALLRDEDVSHFLDAIVDLPELDGHWLNKLLCFLSHSRPVEMLRFLIARGRKSVGGQRRLFPYGSRPAW